MIVQDFENENSDILAESAYSAELIKELLRLDKPAKASTREA